MKRINLYQLCAGLAVIMLSSCGKTDYTRFDSDFTGIYFQKDSMHYSFSVTPLDIETYTLQIPVRIMGATSGTERKFKAEIISDRTTAKAGEQYTVFPETFVIPSDSINGVLPVEFIRSGLSEAVWKLGLRLIPYENFQPTNEKKYEITITFDNLVTPPDWKDWEGNPDWADFALGPWNPNVWIKFMEFFREMEETAPVTYANMVKDFGPNLEKGWPWDYETSVKKYILIPLYDFFEAHPEYGAEIPDPQTN